MGRAVPGLRSVQGEGAAAVLPPPAPVDREAPFVRSAVSVSGSARPPRRLLAALVSRRWGAGRSTIFASATFSPHRANQGLLLAGAPRHARRHRFARGAPRDFAGGLPGGVAAQ